MYVQRHSSHSQPQGGGKHAYRRTFKPIVRGVNQPSNLFSTIGGNPISSSPVSRVSAAGDSAPSVRKLTCDDSTIVQDKVVYSGSRGSVLVKVAQNGFQITSNGNLSATPSRTTPSPSRPPIAIHKDFKENSTASPISCRAILLSILL